MLKLLYVSIYDVFNDAVCSYSGMYCKEIGCILSNTCEAEKCMRSNRSQATARARVFCSNTPGAMLFIYAAVRTLQLGLSELLGFHPRKKPGLWYFRLGSKFCSVKFIV